MIKSKSGCVNALSLEHYLVNFCLSHSGIKFIKEFFANFQSPVLFQDNEHGDIGFLWVGGIVASDDTADDGMVVVGHDGELWPVGEKVVIGVK